MSRESQRGHLGIRRKLQDPGHSGTLYVRQTTVCAPAFPRCETVL